jgi:hypothetical protein
MRNIFGFLFVFSILFSFGCQQSVQSNSPDSARKEKLLAAEKMNTKAELDKTKKELELQKQLLLKAKQDNAAISKKVASDANELNKMSKNYSDINKKLLETSNQLEDCRKKMEAYQKMIDDKDVPGLCKTKIERMKAQVAKCEEEKQQIQKESEVSADFFMKKLPGDLTKQNEALSTENEQLKAKIAELEKQIPPPAK